MQLCSFAPHQWSFPPFPPQVLNAQGFSVDYYPTYKVVHNNIVNESYVLYQCGVQPPAASSFPNGTKFFQIPLTSVSAPETVPFAFLELLGVDDRVQSVSPYTTSACGEKLLACNLTAPDAMQLDNTTMLQDTVGPYVDGVLVSSVEPYAKAFSFNAAQDPGLLSTAEWVKYLGLFFNLDKAATDIFNGIAQAYNATRDAAIAANAAQTTRPTVAWAEHYSYGGDDSYILSFAPYKAELTTDAGGAMLDEASIAAIKGVRPASFSNTSLEFAWDGKNGSFATQAAAQAAFLKVLQGADVVVDETYAVDPSTYNWTAFEGEYGLNTTSASVTSALPWFAGKHVFREDGLISDLNGGDDWYEGAYVRPDKVLADMVRVVAAGRGDTTSQNFTWLRNIQETPRKVDPATCTRLESCSVKPAPICPFVSVCPDGSTTLLKDTESSQCSYENCNTNALTAANTAQMAAPAVIMLTVLIVFVEALINFC